MQVFLEAIKFNHDHNSATSDALTIRKNEMEGIPVPEWRVNATGPSENFPAAYARDAIGQNIITIRARFSCSDKTVRSLEVQAIARQGEALGDVEKATVNFLENGKSDYATFELPNANLDHIGVGTMHWNWQFRSPAINGWISFADSDHRIYTILSIPSSPWDAEPPWTEVLEVACNWATGAHDVDQAATQITNRVFELGGELVSYSRTPAYAQKKFDCTAFLKLLRDGVGKGQTVNCDDCATIVSTFANILGCDLWQSGMGYDFATNYIFIIGSSGWATTGFPRHAVAWKDACEEGDSLFDSCLEVDGDGKPTLKEHKALLPTDIKFGSTRDKKSYKFYLMNQGQCDPDPTHERKRRRIGKSYLGSRKFTSERFLEFLKQHYEFDSWANYERIDQTSKALSLSFSDFLTQQSAFAGWNFGHIEELESDDLVRVIQVLLIRAGGEAQQLVDITAYECRDSVSSSEFLLQLLGQFHQPDLTRLKDMPIGEVAFQEPNGTAVVFKRGKFVSIVRSVGKDQVSGIEMAHAIERYFIILDS